MKRIFRLVQATDQEIRTQGYQDGLQAMWEARWAKLGKGGRADWLRSHGSMPPVLCPLLRPAPTKVMVRLRQVACPASPAGRLLLRLKRAHHLEKARS